MSGLCITKHIQVYRGFVTYGFDYQGEDVTNIDDIDLNLSQSIGMKVMGNYNE